MTWNWNWKLVATGAAALTGVLGIGAPLEMNGPATTPQTAAVPYAELTAVAQLEEQSRRLDQQLAITTAAPPSRNLFRFAERPAPRRVMAPPPEAIAPPAAPAPEPFPMRLTGIAVDVVDGVEKRTAILSGPAGVELAATGEPATAGYRVVEVGDTFAVVERASDGARERLTLK
jgi:hypothetical protein